MIRDSKKARFKEAMAVVANNDARYQINKDRAKNYSQASGAPLYWSVPMMKQPRRHCRQTRATKMPRSGGRAQEHVVFSHAI